MTRGRRRPAVLLGLCCIGAISCREHAQPSVASASEPFAAASPDDARESPIARESPQSAVLRLPRVKVFGALHALMDEGGSGPQLAIGAVVPGPHAYAVGALSNLRGEITVIDDVVWLAYPKAEGKARVVRTKATDEQAALLVVAKVERWKRIPLESEISFEALDGQLEALASANGLNPEEPFPVLIEGPLATLAWHVIDGRKLAAPGENSHVSHELGALAASASNASGMLVGFFSKHHQGVFTHMGSNSHFHCVLPELSLSGHVDRVTVREGASLLLPE